MPATAAYVSTPTITVDGSANAAVRDSLVSLTVEEDIVGLSACEATFRNWGSRNGTPDYLYLARDVFDFGTAVAVSFGPESGQRQVFAGTISAIEAAFPADSIGMITIFAEDALRDLRMTRRTRTFDDSSTSEIADQIARDHGLTAQVDLSGPTRAVSAQLNQSDLAFLRGLARSDGGELWLDGTSLHLGRRAERGTGETIRLTYGSNLLSFTVRADLAHQVSEIAVTGWSVADKDAINETADASALGGELGALTGGSSVLADRLSERKERVVRAEPLAADDARALAAAAYLERARRFVCGTGTTGGTPDARVGSTVTLAGLGGMFDGDYYVARVRHTFDLIDGYRTEMDVERPGIGASS